MSSFLKMAGDFALQARLPRHGNCIMARAITNSRYTCTVELEGQAVMSGTSVYPAFVAGGIEMEASPLLKKPVNG
jgi:hypothetical protein